jgi:hypothetical protein
MSTVKQGERDGSGDDNERRGEQKADRLMKKENRYDTTKQHHRNHENKQNPKRGVGWKRWVGDDAVKTC